MPGMLEVELGAAPPKEEAEGEGAGKPGNKSVGQEAVQGHQLPASHDSMVAYSSIYNIYVCVCAPAPRQRCFNAALTYVPVLRRTRVRT